MTSSRGSNDRRSSLCLPYPGSIRNLRGPKSTCETAPSADRPLLFAIPSQRIPIARARQHYPDHAQACSNHVVGAALDFTGLAAASLPHCSARPRPRPRPSSRGFRSQSPIIFLPVQSGRQIAGTRLTHPTFDAGTSMTAPLCHVFCATPCRNGPRARCDR